MKKIVLFTFLIFLAGTIFPAKIVPMDEVLKPFERLGKRGQSESADKNRQEVEDESSSR
jgi:hypothetical protein